MKSANQMAVATVLSLVGVGATALPASGQLRYRVANLVNQSTAVSVNEAGLSVGETNLKAFSHDGTAMHLLSLPEWQTSYATDTNVSGAIIGRYTTNQNQGVRSFVIANGPPVDIGSLVIGGTTNAVSIARNGAIVGNSDIIPNPNNPSQRISRAFLRMPGSSLQDLGALGTGQVSWAWGVASGDNNELYVVGSAESSSTSASMRPFLYTPQNGMQELGMLPGSFTGIALAVNESGKAVGYCTASSYSLACTWPVGGGQPTSLGALEVGGSSIARAINEHGMIVGEASFGNTAGHAFIHTPTEGMVDLNTLVDNMPSGWYLKAAFDINGSGQIVGVAQSSTSILSWFAFRLDPVTPVICGTSDFNGDEDYGTDADIESFFACLAGQCCSTCFTGGSDFNADGDYGTDADIESFFRVLGGGNC